MAAGGVRPVSVWKQCPGCYHKWLDKYAFDECPRCLCQLSSVEEQCELMSHTFNMEPQWSQTGAQKVARWSSTLRDSLHSGRTPRHNPT